jgi:hypothetical protein
MVEGNGFDDALRQAETLHQMRSNVRVVHTKEARFQIMAGGAIADRQ